jgi:hypothetical protein
VKDGRRVRAGTGWRVGRLPGLAASVSGRRSRSPCRGGERRYCWPVSQRVGCFES